ncbi:hypothetical protein EVAR_59604_1 [Eumeta japonica]|uniref:Uncharacterized protein n=1 Tax=Eumeta variegata TaxID=151549 RepID=A0A4C1Z358_EUMVA|nr:hypothetical protein EVAR_59604_1 [Eumeta japonica]
MPNRPAVVLWIVLELSGPGRGRGRRAARERPQSPSTVEALHTAPHPESIFVPTGRAYKKKFEPSQSPRRRGGTGAGRRACAINAPITVDLSAQPAPPPRPHPPRRRTRRAGALAAAEPACADAVCCPSVTRSRRMAAISSTRDPCPWCFKNITICIYYLTTPRTGRLSPPPPP